MYIIYVSASSKIATGTKTKESTRCKKIVTMGVNINILHETNFTFKSNLRIKFSADKEEEKDKHCQKGDKMS